MKRLLNKLLNNFCFLSKIIPVVFGLEVPKSNSSNRGNNVKPIGQKFDHKYKSKFIGLLYYFIVSLPITQKNIISIDLI